MACNKVTREDYEIIKDRVPVDDGFFMPAEYWLHHGTLMIWPFREGSWGINPEPSQKAFIRIFEEITKSEELYILADKEHMADVQSAVSHLNHVHILEIPSDDAWARDVGPTFVSNNMGDIRAVNWRFNAWGGDYDGLYSSWDLDNSVALKFCESENVKAYDAEPFVLEGGSIHTDGEGTAIVTETCLLSKGRNPEMSREEIEDKLCKYLGVTKVLWLPFGIYNDETNEHVDNVCAFVGPTEVVLAWTDNEDDPQYEMSRKDYEYLSSVTDAKGRKLVIHKLPIPDHPILISEDDVSLYAFEEGEDNREAGERLAASYVNFYFTNNEVLIPAFGGDNTESDDRAARLLQDICKTRKVVQIPAGKILMGGGNIHCITQQIPDKMPHPVRKMQEFV